MYLFELLYQYFDEIYLSASLSGNYKYLNFTKTSTTLLMIVGGLCLGMLIASAFAIYQKKHVGKVVRALLAAEAYDKESAKTLEELGLQKSGIAKHALSTASAVRKLLTVVEGDEVYSYRDELAAAFPEYAAYLKEEEEKAKAEAEKAKAESEAGDNPSAEGEESPEAADESKAEDPIKEITKQKEEISSKEKDIASEKEENGAQEGEKADGVNFKEESNEDDSDTESEEKTESGKKKGEKLKKFFFEKRFRVRKPNFESARFFIPEELRYRAEFRFKEKGNSWWGLILAFVILSVIFLLCLRFIPVFVNMLDVAIGNVIGK